MMKLLGDMGHVEPHSVRLETVLLLVQLEIVVILTQDGVHVLC
jgi:hypothetical protein